MHNPLLAQLLAVLIPPACYVCGEPPRVEAGLHTDSPRFRLLDLLGGKKGSGPDEMICLACRDQLIPTGRGQWAAGLSTPGLLDQAWCAFWYNGAVQRLVYLLKYRRFRRLGGWLGEAAYQALSDILPWRQYDLVIPVPLHPVRRRQRDFNQAEVIAQSIARLAGLPLETRALQRHRWTPSQVGLSVEERRLNVAGCFRVTRRGDGLAALLVDDLLTTGATSAACAAALKMGGYGRVGVLTVATTRKGE